MVLIKFNEAFHHKRTKDMLTRKVATLNPNCKRFNAIYKCLRLVGRSGENDNDLMRRARKAYRDESKSENKSFTQDGAWAILITPQVGLARTGRPF